MEGVRFMIVMRLGMVGLWLCELEAYARQGRNTNNRGRGALEPQFFAALLEGLQIDAAELGGPREDRRTWLKMKELFTTKFRTKDRAEWVRTFDGTEACCTPVLTHDELRHSGRDQRPLVTLKSSPGRAIAEGSSADRSPAEGQGAGVEGSGWTGRVLEPGEGGDEVLAEWMGWKRGVDYDQADGGLIKLANNASKL